ncbi:MAG: hypothetical protein FWC47_07560 [Oscillospiraceae bacterium]|nr:hypothetical protein [Oscillospiraceae bacterium]
MKKPSIFSSKYHETVKRIRRRNTLVVILVICVILTIFAIFNDKINKLFFWINQNYVGVVAPESQSTATENTLNTSNEQTNDTNDTQSQINKSENIIQSTTDQTSQAQIKPVEVVQYYTLKLASGRDIKIYYEEKNNQILFTGKSDDADYITLSPSKKRVCIIDKTNQDMYIMFNNNTYKNITKTVYIATGGSSDKYYKSDQLARFNNNYLWHDMAKFLTEDEIAYRSRLPYFIANNLNLYLWIYDITTDVHKCMFDLPPGNIEILDLDEIGLKITDSGKNYYLKADNSIVPR